LTSCLDCKLALNYVGSPRRFSSQDLQDRKCHFLLEWQKNQIIISFQNGWCIRYATGKKCVMLGFSLLQLVTSESRAIAILKAQLTQSLPCSFHVPATRRGIASVYPTPTKHDLPPVTIMICPGVSQRIPPLFRHVMGVGTDIYQLPPLANRVHDISDHALKLISALRSFRHRKMFPSQPCE
jgi:hypothetical protein